MVVSEDAGRQSDRRSTRLARVVRRAHGARPMPGIETIDVKATPSRRRRAVRWTLRVLALAIALLVVNFAGGYAVDTWVEAPEVWTASWAVAPAFSRGDDAWAEAYLEEYSVC